MIDKSVSHAATNFLKIGFYTTFSRVNFLQNIHTIPSPPVFLILNPLTKLLTILEMKWYN